MSNDQTIKAGDIIEWTDGKRDYIFRHPVTGQLGVNACARSYVDRGDKNYGDELYLLLDVDMSDVTIVDHYGDGSSIDGCRWYESQKIAEEVR